MSKILVVDDDELVRELARFKLAAAGHQVEAAHNGRVALDLVEQAQPDLIILDLMMPVMSGPEMLSHLQSSPAYSSIPVIMLSLRSCQDDIVAALRAGACDYIVKPFVPDELVARVERHLALRTSIPKFGALAVAASAALALAVSPAAAQSERPSIEQANAAHSKGDHRSASMVLDRLLVFEPENADLWLKLGLERSHVEDFNGAEAALEQGLLLEPDYKDIQLALANVKRWKADIARIRSQLQTPSQRRIVETLAPHLETEPKSHKWAASVSHSYSWDNNSPQNVWNDTSFAVALTSNKDATYVLQAERASRFGLTDTTVGLQGAWRVGRELSAYLGASAAIKPDFRENWGLRAGGAAGIAPGVEVSLDGRLSKFGRKTIAAATPKLAFTDRSDRFTATLGWINLLDEGGKHRVGWSLRGDVRPSERLSLYAGAARYPETETGITRQTETRFLGLAYSLRSNFRLSIGYEEERRKLSATRNGLTVGIRWKFGSHR